MPYRKYLDDYRVEEHVDAKGRTKKRAVYVGGDYILYPAISTNNKRLILALTILLWIPFIAALFPISAASQLFYVMLPFIFSAVPLFMMSGAAVSLMWEYERMTREKAEKIANRLPICSVSIAILSGIALIGLIVTALFSDKEMFTGDILFGSMSVILIAAASVIFSKCRLIKSRLAD